MLIKVKVFPGSKKEEVTKMADDEFEVKLTEKPERGKANKELIWLLSAYFKVSASKIRFVKGFRQRSKIIDISPS
jgi:hypothetical protein